MIIFRRLLCWMGWHRHTYTYRYHPYRTHMQCKDCGKEENWLY
jgi:hypothetical protein